MLSAVDLIEITFFRQTFAGKSRDGFVCKVLFVVTWEKTEGGYRCAEMTGRNC